MKIPSRYVFFLLFLMFCLGGLTYMDWKVFGGGKAAPENISALFQAMQEESIEEFAPVIEPAAGVEAAAVMDTPPRADLEPILVRASTVDGYFDDPAAVRVQETAKKQSAVFPQSLHKIAIIIDDIGMDIEGSRESVNLPAPVTLAILPYAPDAKGFAKSAKERGHEIIIHTPMEALDANLDLGPLALRSSDSGAAFNATFDAILNSFEGYSGINNHMGSKLTRDPVMMGVIMEKLKERSLFFIDSRTHHETVAGQAALTVGVPFASRDVFLDHEDTPAYIAQALKNVERIAREHGSAIAIGHPKEATLSALRAWIPTLAAKGFTLVPAGELVKKQNGIAARIIEAGGAVTPAVSKHPLPPG